MAIRLVPRHGDALRLLGLIYLQGGKPEQALPLLRDALQAQAKNLEILNNLGIALRDTGRDEEAATHFRQALALNPRLCRSLNKALLH